MTDDTVPQNESIENAFTDKIAFVMELTEMEYRNI